MFALADFDVGYKCVEHVVQISPDLDEKPFPVDGTRTPTQHKGSSSIHAPFELKLGSWTQAQSVGFVPKIDLSIQA